MSHPTEQNPSNTSSSKASSSSSCTAKSRDQIDSQLAGAGYKIRSSELQQVAQRLEQLESVMVHGPAQISQLVNDAVLYNPSDLASWVDSLLSELNQPAAVSEYSDLSFVDQTVNPSAWMDRQLSQQQREIIAQHFPFLSATEEDSGIQLVHVLMTCAESLDRGEISLAGLLIDEMRVLLTRVNTACGIGKVAGYFIDALSRRIFTPQGIGSTGSASQENEVLYHHFYEACPYLKFAHFTANQAILEALDGHDCVHVIDFNLMHGLQWPALIQALALRPGGPPLLRLTGIGPPSLDGRDLLHEIGLRLAEFARSVTVRFAFRGIAASCLGDIKPWMLQVNQSEAVAVNSIMQLHRLLIPDPARGSPIDVFLGWIRTLNPKIVTVVEQEANHNQPEFLDRFADALYYYSTMFDSLEACSAQPEKALAEMYIQREICNVLCCEGSARVERHEPLVKWRSRLGGAGFRPVHLGSNAYKQASMLLTLFSAEGYCVEENEGCLTLGWHSRPLIAASAWQAVDEADGPNPGTPPLGV
ncbi:hypothetical protein NMG60_11021787 [Bertholletia excelsa]